MPKRTPEEETYAREFELQLRRIDREIEEWPSVFLGLYSKRIYESGKGPDTSKGETDGKTDDN